MNSSAQFEEFFKDFSCNCKNVQKKSFKKGPDNNNLYSKEKSSLYFTKW